MSGSRIVPPNIFLPTPAGTRDRAVNQAIVDMYRPIARRLNAAITSGTASEIPTSDGSDRFFFATDTETLYFDTAVGWVPIPSGNVFIEGQFGLTGDITPPALTTDEDDYDPTGLATASVLRLSSDAEHAITGLEGGSDGRIAILLNVGANPIVLSDEDALSAADNRFAIGTNSPVNVPYDITTVSGNTVLDETHQVVFVNAAGGNVTITLPTGVDMGNGFYYIIKKVDISGHTVTVASDGVDLIDGTLTKVISSAYSSMTVVWSGSLWGII